MARLSLDVVPDYPINADKIRSGQIGQSWVKETRQYLLFYWILFSLKCIYSNINLDYLRRDSLKVKLLLLVFNRKIYMYICISFSYNSSFYFTNSLTKQNKKKILLHSIFRKHWFLSLNLWIRSFLFEYIGLHILYNI